MSYNSRLNWKDHVVTRPNTYREITNSDGTITHTHVPGEVLQQGTPQSATNFNEMVDVLQHTAIALDFFMTITQAEKRDLQDRLETVEAQLAALSS